MTLLRAHPDRSGGSTKPLGGNSARSRCRRQRPSTARSEGEWGSPDPPTTYADFEDVLDEYEAKHFHYTDNAGALMRASEHIVNEQLPPLLQPLARNLTRAIFDRRLCRCLGLRPAGPVLGLSVRALMQLRAARECRSAPPSGAWSTPGQPNPMYPDGYTLDEVGPRPDGRPKKTSH